MVLVQVLVTRDSATHGTYGHPSFGGTSVHPDRIAEARC
jgi:hypothetical protein